MRTSERVESVQNDAGNPSRQEMVVKENICHPYKYIDELQSMRYSRLEIMGIACIAQYVII